MPRKRAPCWVVDDDKREVWFSGKGDLNSGRFSNMTPFTQNGETRCVEQWYVLNELNHFTAEGGISALPQEFYDEFFVACPTGAKAKEFWNYCDVAHDSKTLEHTRGRYPGKSEVKELAVKWRRLGVKPAAVLLKPTKWTRNRATNKDRLEFKKNAMRRAHLVRATYDTEFKAKLLKYQGYRFIENLPDKIWGYGANGEGQNLQGQLLMELSNSLALESQEKEKERKRVFSSEFFDVVDGDMPAQKRHRGDSNDAPGLGRDALPPVSRLICGLRPAALDQFFTKPEVARQCLELVKSVVGPLEHFQRILEPSAGAGAFFNQLPTSVRIGIDLDAAAGSPYVKKDFLKVSPGLMNMQPPPLETQDGLKVSLPPNCAQVLVVGNPPFGKNAALAIEFVNHALKFANTVCFVLPRTFNKASVQDRIDLRAHLLLAQDLDSRAFLFEGDDYDVPCTFHIWSVRGSKRRPFQATLSHPDFEFVSSSSQAGVFAVQRVGVHAGRVKMGKAMHAASPSSHYFIKPKHKHVIEHMRGADMANSLIKQQTAGCPSISKDELIAMYVGQLDSATSAEPARQTTCHCLSCLQP